MGDGHWSRTWLAQAYCLVLVLAQTPREYSMDEYATCGRTMNVDDTGILLIGRGNAAPSNPPLECIVYLQSAYSRDDGSNKLQVKVVALNIRDCNVKLDLYNGRTSVGQTLQALSCQYSTTGLIYSTGREVTVRFTRPDRVTFNDYQFTLEIKPYKDLDVPGTKQGVTALSVPAIIGIVIGCLVLVALVILFLWCCCTGRLSNLNVPGMSLTKVPPKERDKSAIISEKPKPVSVIEYKPSEAWNANVAGKYETTSQDDRGRLYQRGAPRSTMGRRFDTTERNGLYRNAAAASEAQAQNRRSGHEYEQYENERKLNEAEEERRKGQRKETLIDDVFDSDTATQVSNTTDETEDAEKSGRGKKRSPGEGDISKDSPRMESYKSMDLQSVPDSDTISSPMHVNAAVRASIEDDLESPQGSLRRKNSKSPRAKRKGFGGGEPDSMALPPEAFEPIFTKPITGLGYKGGQSQFGEYPGGFIPYGLIPAGVFAPGIPGSQTYAYAYQMGPQSGMIGQPVTQGAVFMQNTPTTEGNRRTAIAVEETVSPDKSRMISTPETHRRKTEDPFKKTRYDNSNNMQLARPKDHGAPDLSIIARGIAPAPPDPGQNHRSVSMMSGTDAKTGIHTAQVVWTDTVADPTDPKPNENPKITRKTITRVTTKSGYTELPPLTSVLSEQEEEPAFLAPSSNSKKALMPSAYTPGAENIAFYSGNDVHHTVAPPEQPSIPEPAASVYHPTSYSHAIRDRILFDDSTV